MRTKEIIERNGLSKQKRKFVEECYELTEAITEMQVSPSAKNLSHIVGELADTFVVWRQFVEYYNIDWAEIAEIANQKVERTLARMNEKSVNL